VRFKHRHEAYLNQIEFLIKMRNFKTFLDNEIRADSRLQNHVYSQAEELEGTL
jgi:hypothetical protein